MRFQLAKVTVTGLTCDSQRLHLDPEWPIEPRRSPEHWRFLCRTRLVPARKHQVAFYDGTNST
jgi:hypothetical protein